MNILTTRQIIARAKSHYLPGQVWHIAHRCHKRAFLLKLKIDIEEIEMNFKALQECTAIAIPGEITFAILDGVNPIRAWREYKRLKMNELAKNVGISAAYHSQIQNNKRIPTIDTLRSIVKELGIEIEMLI